MKRILSLLVLASGIAVYSQTVIYQENFETGGGSVTINTSDLGGSTTSDNPWVINNIYAGGSGSFFCTTFGIILSFTVPAASTQPGGITGAPYSTHLHITPQIAIDGGGTLPAASYVVADGLCLFGGSSTFTRMNSDISTVGHDSVSFNFWWMCGGSSAYYGELYYSTNGGSAWTAVTCPVTSTTEWRNQTTWVQTALTNPAWSGQPTLRFGYRFISGSSSGGSDLDPGFAIDQIVITGYDVCSQTSSSISPVACTSYMVPSGDETYTASGIYSDTIPNSEGCDSIISINLTIANSSSSQSTTACNAYTWPLNGNSYTMSGSYNDTIPNHLGCDSVITLNLTINTVNVGVTNASPMLTANTSGAAYQWLNCESSFAIISGETGQSFTATSNGNYAVAITDNGCTDTSACITISNLSITENSYGSALFAYPNPTQGEFSINLGANYANINITVYNSLGEKVMDKVEQGEKVNLILDGAPGIYMITITSNGKQAKLKVIKE